MRPWQFRLSSLVYLITFVSAALALWRKGWEVVSAESAFVTLAGSGVAVALVPLASTLLFSTGRMENSTRATSAIVFTLMPFAWWLLFVWMSLPSFDWYD